MVQDEIPTTTVRILLNHFKWDKERLMERLYSEDQEAMFQEAQVQDRRRINDITIVMNVMKSANTSPPGHFALQEEPPGEGQEAAQAVGRARVRDLLRGLQAPDDDRYCPGIIPASTG